MKRQIGYDWRLREAMASRGVFTATELVPLLKDRGIDLSASQVHRLVSGTPERLSLQVLVQAVDEQDQLLTAGAAGVRRFLQQAGSLIRSVVAPAGRLAGAWSQWRRRGRPRVG